MTEPRAGLGPFTVERSDGWTECSCITDPCRHGDERMREYQAWTVWDNEANRGRGDHAHVTRGSAFDVEYERKRDAVAAARSYLASRPAESGPDGSDQPSPSSHAGIGPDHLGEGRVESLTAPHPRRLGCVARENGIFCTCPIEDPRHSRYRCRLCEDFEGDGVSVIMHMKEVHLG